MAPITPKITIFKWHRRLENPLRNFVLCSILSWASSKNVFILEHDYADRWDICNATLKISAHA